MSVQEAVPLTPPPTTRAPLSLVQDAWSEGFEGGFFKPGFVVSDAVRIRGELDVDSLQGALDDVVARHEILRTVVVRDASPRHQAVSPPCRVPLEVRVHEVAPEDDRELVVDRLQQELEQREIPTDRPPILRAVVDRLDPEDAVLTVISHHTACDALSLQIIFRDLAEFYRARVEDDQPALPPLSQYRDYVEWDRSLANNAAYLADRAHWKRELDGARIFAFPTDRPVSPDSQTRYVAERFEIGPDLMPAIGALAREVRGSVFMVLLAGFNLLAHAITGQTDVVVNSQTSGRVGREFRDTVGLFLGFHPLRTNLARCRTFRDVLEQTRTVCLDSYRHPVRIEDIERDSPALMQPLRDHGVSDTIFGFYSYPITEAQVRFAESTHRVQLQDRDAATDMPGGIAWGMGARADDHLAGKVEYNPDEFDQSTVARWTTWYKHILRAAVDDPDQPWEQTWLAATRHRAPRH